MPHMREVKTCDRCRHFKRRCDLLKPSCTRCVQAGVRCSFDVTGTAAPSAGTQAAATVAPQRAGTFGPTGAQHAPPPLQQQQQQHHASNLQASPQFASSSAVGGPRAANAAMPAPSNAPPPASGPVNGAAVASSSSASPGQDDLAGTPTNGLISPTTSTESPEPGSSNIQDQDEPPTPHDAPTSGSATTNGQRIVRKRKRNCLSCLRCHRLKVKCDKELPCGRCKASGNGRECYYSYNKGPNGGKFPCPTAPVPSSKDEKKPQMATWQVQHRVRGSSHWRELMTKVC